jgi:signal transduction histidine kinase
MDIYPPQILLQENGCKVLAATNGGDDLRLVTVELQGKIVRVGEGDLDVSVGFANRADEIGDLGRSFNRMVKELGESREEVARLHGEQMSSAECFATIGELASGLAHEIRNSLAGIAGVIEIVGRDLPVTSPAYAAVKDVRLEIAQFNHILTDLLQTARPHLPEIRPSDLNVTVEHSVALARQQGPAVPIRINFHKNPNLPIVEHDSGQIHQVVLNLLLNAVQAMDGAGAIRVEISLLKSDAVITVADTGRGIAPEHLPNIFRPFYTTKAKGTGLGLSLSRRIANEHHGRIEVTSEVGKGSTFLLVLPIHQAIARGVAA